MIRYNAREIQSLFDEGKNIIEWFRARENEINASPTAIAYSYDAQAGSYTAALRDPATASLKKAVGKKLAELFDNFSLESMLEAGTGEATTFVEVLKAMQKRPKDLFAFDISFSRLLFGHKHLIANGIDDVTLFTGSLDRIPVSDSSVDVVFTFHAIEPNHGQEEAILRELLRVARRFLILVEPSYELGNAETRVRIDRLRYVKGLPSVLEGLGCAPKRLERWELDANPENQAALIVVEKHPEQPQSSIEFISPISGRPLVRKNDCWFCPEDGHAFPVISGIPCLLVDNGILASKLENFEASPGTVSRRSGG